MVKAYSDPMQSYRGISIHMYIHTPCTHRDILIPCSHMGTYPCPLHSWFHTLVLHSYGGISWTPYSHMGSYPVSHRHICHLFLTLTCERESREVGSSLGMLVAYPFCCWEVEGTWGLLLTRGFMEFSEYTLMSTSHHHPSLHQLMSSRSARNDLGCLSQYLPSHSGRWLCTGVGLRASEDLQKDREGAAGTLGDSGELAAGPYGQRWTTYKIRAELYH